MKNRISCIILASCLIAGILPQRVWGGTLSLNMLSALLSSFEGELSELLPEQDLQPAPENTPVWEDTGPSADQGVLSSLPAENELLPEEEPYEEFALIPEPELLEGEEEEILEEDELVEILADEQAEIDEELSEPEGFDTESSDAEVLDTELPEEDPDEADREEDSEHTSEEEDPEEGGYRFAGYLEEGIPNYVWEGEGRPSVLGDELVSSGEPLLNSELLLSSLKTGPLLAGISPASEGGNYIADTPGSRAYHGCKTFSNTVESSMKDGLHTISPGKVRAYKGGRYFIDGGFALDGKRYYADENGFLIGGWQKTLSDSSIQDAGSVINDKLFGFRFYDRNTYVMQTGYKKIDGLWHYFNESGVMPRNYPITIDGKFYYADQYGICEQIKLRYGNTLISEANQNNDAYNAKNFVNVVDINTFTGQKGEYSFRPKWYPDVSTLELFGFPEVMDEPSGVYCMLKDESLQGKVGCIYHNVGRYKGREIDLKVIVTGYDFFDFCGDREAGYFYVDKNNIGLNAVNTKNITADLIFLDHETGRETEVKGYATFTDIDVGQSVSILSPVDELYVDKECVLYKDPASNTFTSPFISERIGTAVNDPDREYWVQANFTGSRLSMRLGAPYEQFEFADSGLDIAGECRYVWLKNYTGNPHDYSLFSAWGSMVRSWQGIYPKRLGRVSIPPVAKTVSDEDEIDVTKNRLRDDELRYTYTLSHNVPGENEEFYYDTYTVSDVFEEGLVIDKKGIYVTNDNETDVTGLFDISVEGQRVEFRAHTDILKSDSFYDNNYNYHIPVEIEDVESLRNMDKEDYIIYNTCTAEFSRLGSSENATSNETETRIRIPLSFGSVTITKRISEADIVWAHGNPTFLFRAEGKDEKGNSHRYEEFLCFKKGGYALTGDGFAEVSVTITHVPCGTYRVTELPVMDYYLTGAEAATKNMRITSAGEPGKGKDPALVAYGTGTLSREEPDAGIIFYDAKGNYSGYRHTDVVCNTLPLILN